MWKRFDQYHDHWPMRLHVRDRGNNVHGITLVDLAVSIVLIGAIALVTSWMFVFSVDGFRLISTTQDSLDNARLAIEMLERDLHAIRDRANFTASSAEITFTDMNMQTVNFSYDNGRLMRNGYPVAEGIQDFSFRFESKDGGMITSPADSIDHIWNIKIFIIATNSGRAIRLDTIIHPRNF